MPGISVAGLDADFSPYPDLTLNKYVNLPIAVSEPDADYPGWSDPACYTLSPRRPNEEYKRMVLEHTHGLFIT